LHKLENIVDTHRALTAAGSVEAIDAQLMARAKKMGFADTHIASLVGSNEAAVRAHRKSHGIVPFVKRIDTLAAEYPAHTNYLYTTYNASEHDVDFDEHGTMVLGSGVYRIGSSVEFDWCAVTCARSLRDQGVRTIMVNYNPETVSTDFDEADRLYFEELGWERVMDIFELEGAQGVVVSVGGARFTLRPGVQEDRQWVRSIAAEYRIASQREWRQGTRNRPGEHRYGRGPP
jgi:carbamoyl-phosphate synthase large subunit